MKRNYGFWSEKEDNRLRKLYRDLPASMLTKVFDRTRKSIDSRAKRLGIMKRDIRYLLLEVDNIREQRFLAAIIEDMDYGQVT